MKSAELTQTISDTLPKLRKSERKVADLVLKEPLSIINMRIAHLVMIDVLAIGVAQKKGPKLEEHLQLMQAGLSSLRSD